MNQKTCWIVAGPNGAGKSTLARKYLPSWCAAYINADNIVRENGLDGATPEGLIKSGRLFHERLDSVIASGESFAIETTLSGRTHLKTIKRLKTEGWRVELHYIYIPNLEFSAERVRVRVLDGGHDVPIEDIRRRYARSITNVNAYSELCDYTACYDNSNAMPGFVFIRHGNAAPFVVDERIYNIVVNGAGVDQKNGVDVAAESALVVFQGAVRENLEWKSKIDGNVVIADDYHQPVVKKAKEVLSAL